MPAALAQERTVGMRDFRSFDQGRRIGRSTLDSGPLESGDRFSASALAPARLECSLTARCERQTSSNAPQPGLLRLNPGLSCVVDPYPMVRVWCVTDACESPAWEEKRLAALRAYRVLDTPREDDFDEVVQLAAQICRTPVAAISLVEDRRQWFKAEVGLGIRETPIDVSVCATTVLTPGLTVVPDMSLDPRFAANPLIASFPYLRFYAGARLETPDGLPLGSLCVLDRNPRAGLSREQASALMVFARQVTSQLELRRAVTERDEALSIVRQSEARQHLLVRELHHRTRNNLAVLQALFGVTARASGSVDELYRAFSDRIASLARTQALLSDDYWQTVRLDDLLAHEFEWHLSHDTGRVVLDGPELDLAADLAVPLGMALHELRSNAERHGALSSAGGRVKVQWGLVRQDGKRLLHLVWSEHGSHRAKPPFRAGVGTKIQKMLEAQCGAEVNTEHRPEGFWISVTAPLVEARLVPEY
ncbi:sensor histidine kinase [Methylobacterium sp. WSM2598]|uniref:sensor histidine kinase n=1 Tax=Methylobacterium sp. WSM2598 TaxID=398261 RepID=UPI001F15F920|nr:HWE histidine kinase domain-containing protein [Methylobacterium sp. WSM2598]